MDRGTTDGDREAALSDRCLNDSWIIRIEFGQLGSLAQRCQHLGGRDVDAAWLERLSRLAASLPLLDSSTTTGLGTELLAAAAAPRLTPQGLVPATIQHPAATDQHAADQHAADQRAADQRSTAQGLAELVLQLDRMIAWAGAQQAAAMSALGRPGVAVPIGDLLDAVTHGGTGGPLGVDSTDALRGADFEAASWQDVSVHDDPAWHDAAADQAQRIAAAEIGARLAWTPATAKNRMFESTDIVDALPLAHRLWARGHLDRTRIIAIADRTQDLDPAARAHVEQQLLADDGALLRSKTPTRVRALVDRCAAALDPDAIRRRQERARQDRDIYLTPREDGISRFCADVPTPVAVLARSVIDHVAQNLPSDGTIGQRRADVFADLFTQLAAHGHVDLRGGHEQPGNAHAREDGPATAPGDALDGEAAPLTPHPQPEPPGSVDAQHTCSLLPPDWERIDSGDAVIIDAATLTAATLTDTDLTDTAAIEGALLGAHPALPVDLVHALARSATRARIAIRGLNTPRGADPCASGCASASTNLTVGADLYRPTVKLAEQIILRDRTCRFPGCRHPARRCDLDHRKPFAEGGPTTAENLDAMCRFHHRLKTFTRWRAIRKPGNQLTWTTPLGATITDHPELPPPF